jgi:hypothetical protein
VDLNRPVPEVDAWLEAFRMRSDDLADAAALELIAARRPLSDDLEALKVVGPAGRRLYEHVHTVPAWVDFDAMRVGSQLGLRNVVQSALALICGSLMGLYAAARGAKVLMRSGRLVSSQVMARLADTTGFVLEVAAARGPRPGSYAHRHIVRTRLVHAYIRHGILKAGGWDAKAWGHPINQEDYAGTLLGFSYVFLRCLERIGVRPTAEEAASVQHLYRWVGQLMGVDPQLLTKSCADEQLFYGHVLRRQLQPDDDSRALAAALLTTLDRKPPLFLPAAALAELSRDMLGDPLADALALPRAPGWAAVSERALPLFCQVQRTVERLPLATVPIELLGEQLARFVYTRGIKG